MRRACLATVFVLTLLPISAEACLWDYDTLRDEQQGLPTVAAVLAGKWERHSDFFYEQRVEQMRAHLAEDPHDLAAIDNLAVALEKLGRTDEAIELMQEKLALPDDGEQPHYTTHANLGTFYLHRWGSEGDPADLDRGIEHIRQALDINPNAHFGREKYQLQVAEYLRAAESDPAVLDRGSFVIPLLIDLERLSAKIEERHADWVERGSLSEAEPTVASAATDRMYHIRATGRMSAADEQEVNAAIKGIVGMIRFGTGRSPHLYYALGDLLAARGDKHLAARAYLRALEFSHPRPEQIQTALETVVEHIHGESLTDIKAAFAREMQEAAQWVAAYQKYEDALVCAGKDVTDGASYADFYAAHGSARPHLGFAIVDHLPRNPYLRTLMFLGSGVLVLLVGVSFLRLWLRRRPRQPGAFA